ncbi:hypothetical protein LguiA_021997 [Lonicera macranthoides]
MLAKNVGFHKARFDSLLPRVLKGWYSHFNEVLYAWRSLMWGQDLLIRGSTMVHYIAQTNGTIPVGASLTATQNCTPWLSPSADFAFGFQFLLQNGLFLLSIWYYNLPEKAIVWYENDGNFVPSGTILELNAQNGLVLTDPQGTQLWSS